MLGIAMLSIGVALRKESVDRNGDYVQYSYNNNVALRKESVDRNVGWLELFLYYQVALRKESVDRNPTVIVTGCVYMCRRSPQGERG